MCFGSNYTKRIEHGSKQIYRADDRGKHVCDLLQDDGKRQKKLVSENLHETGVTFKIMILTKDSKPHFGLSKSVDKTILKKSLLL